MVRLLLCATNAPASLRLTSPSTSQFFVEPDRTVTLRWSHEPTAAGSFKEAIVRDYSGRETARLPVARPNAGIVEVTAKLPRGYYTLFFPESGQEFGLVVLPACKVRSDFFSVDTALSQLVPPDRRPDLIEAMRRAGIAAARERLSWNRIESQPARWDRETRQCDQTRRDYARAGVGVLDMCIGTPAWMEKDKAGIFPRDLIATANAWGDIGEHWASCWQGLEIWNEPDIAPSGNQPADQSLPTLKAARNGLLDQSDVLSFHYYGEPEDLQDRVGEYRAWMRSCGHGSLPLWITEIGPAWAGQPGTRTPPAEDAVRALKFARNAAEARACGVARIFPFVMVDYSEQGSRNFGMLDPAGSPLRVMGVYAAAIRELSGGQYIGDL